MPDAGAGPSEAGRPRIYLAGPEVFFPNALAQGEEKKRLCADHGFEGVYPLDTSSRTPDRCGRKSLPAASATATSG